MNIESVKNEQALNSTKTKGYVSNRLDQGKLQGEKKLKQRQDKLELSSEARNYQIIQSKIANGTYNKPEVLKEVAIKLNKEIPQGNNPS
jgi:Ca2+-dependent lipid-binding protein